MSKHSDIGPKLAAQRSLGRRWEGVEREPGKVAVRRFEDLPSQGARVGPEPSFIIIDEASDITPAMYGDPPVTAGMLEDVRRLIAATAAKTKGSPYRVSSESRAAVKKASEKKNALVASGIDEADVVEKMAGAVARGGSMGMSRSLRAAMKSSEGGVEGHASGARKGRGRQGLIASGVSKPSLPAGVEPGIASCTISSYNSDPKARGGRPKTVGEPWVALGMTKATYYRKRAEGKL